MKEITKEKIEELKNKHGDIYEASIVYRNSDGKRTEIEFLHRAPVFAEYERMQKEVVESGPMTAAGNMAVSLILHPEAQDIRSKLTECPIAFDRWFAKAVLPFFGGDVLKAESQKI